MSKFTLFKKVIPTTIIALAPQVFALSNTTCGSDNSRFALMYSDVSFRAGGTYAFFDYAKFNGVEFHGGSGAMMGRGKITESALELNLTWTQTGSKIKVPMGILKGRKVNGQWELKIVPVDKNALPIKSATPIKLPFCDTDEV